MQLHHFRRDMIHIFMSLHKCTDRYSLILILKEVLDWMSQSNLLLSQGLPGANDLRVPLPGHHSNGEPAGGTPAIHGRFRPFQRIPTVLLFCQKEWDIQNDCRGISTFTSYLALSDHQTWISDPPPRAISHQRLQPRRPSIPVKPSKLGPRCHDPR